MVHMFGNVIEAPQKQKMAAPQINAIGGHVFFHKISLFFYSGISSWHEKVKVDRSIFLSLVCPVPAVQSAGLFSLKFLVQTFCFPLAVPAGLPLVSKLTHYPGLFHWANFDTFWLALQGACQDSDKEDLGQARAGMGSGFQDVMLGALV
jgi:hypothetical protein